MSKALLIETQSFQTVGTLTEAKVAGGNPMVEGILATAERQKRQRQVLSQVYLEERD
jgi:hypothetical protein